MGGPPPGGNEPPGGYGTTGGLPPNQQHFMFATGEKFEIPFFLTVGGFKDWRTSVAMKASSASPDRMIFDWLLAPSREGARREEFVDIESRFWRVDVRLAPALHHHCMTIRDKLRYDEFEISPYKDPHA